MKLAMTYLEMILSLIIISITVSISYPHFNDDRLEVAADELIAKMKYVSYLATLNDNFDVKDKYFRYKLWQIKFHNQLDKEEVAAYSILKDKRKNDDNPLDLRSKNAEFLFDNFVGKKMSPYAVRYERDRKKVDKSALLNIVYGVDGFIFPDNCNIGKSQTLMFDRYGNVYHRYNRVKYKDGFFKSSLVKPKCNTYKLILYQGEKNNPEKKVGICVETSTSYIYKCKA